MRRPCHVLVVPVLCAVSLVACGSSVTTPTVPNPREANSLAAWRAAVQCARRHGMGDLPDPVIDAGGRVTLPGIGRHPIPTPAVQSACAAQIRAITSLASTQPSASGADTLALVRVAACIRRHGLPRWPDPDPSQPGTFHVASADAGTWGQLGRAVNACRGLIPAGGWHLSITPSGH